MRSSSSASASGGMDDHACIPTNQNSIEHIYITNGKKTAEYVTTLWCAYDMCFLLLSGPGLLRRFIMSIQLVILYWLGRPFATWLVFMFLLLGHRTGCCRWFLRLKFFLWTFCPTPATATAAALPASTTAWFFTLLLMIFACSTSPAAQQLKLTWLQ